MLVARAASLRLSRGYGICVISGPNFMQKEGEVEMHVLRQLWADEAGFVVSSELVLIATMLVIAMVVGLQTVRDGVLQELGDVGAAIGAISQDYSYGGATGHCSSINGSQYIDATDACEKSDANNRSCVEVCLEALCQE